ncbi:MAG: methyl-accepting chemotaxis protein [Tenuifilaceae bacterium]|jgi:methyl-accepting chemotaxis protein|nr:methyl-accepting chemotaxis protein [Tenuifilaceae bacterium]
MKLKNVKIGTKLISSYILIAALTGVVGLLGTIEIRTINNADTMLYERMTAPLSSVNEMTTYFQRLRVAVRDMLLAETESDKRVQRDLVFNLQEQFNKTAETYQKTVSNDEEQAVLDNTKNALKNYILYFNDFTQLVWADKKQEAVAFMKGDWQKPTQDLQDAIQNLVQFKTEQAKQTAQNNTQIASRATTIMLIIAFISIVLAASIGIAISMGITAPLAKGVEYTKRLAAGDLTAQLEIDQKDEVGILARSLKDMVQKLREVVTIVKDGAENIAASSLQLSSASQELSQGASEQASSTEEASSSMEEMAANIQQNTDNAQQAEKIATSGAEGIKKGNEASNTAVVSMKQIAEKVSIISDIAFQTNILALNAAVEAARAGEQGRGFAVVAAEVRKLAERSKVAADEIEKLTKFGVKEAEDAGLILAQIVPEVEKTARLVQEISAASLEQTSGSDQINTAIQQLNQITQRTAAASEELATSAEELSSQAEQLNQVISFFRIEEQRTIRRFQHTEKKENGWEKSAPSKYKEAPKKVILKPALGEREMPAVEYEEY